jgi:hypothetical protein
MDYTVYLNKGNKYELLIDRIPIPEGAGLLTFADFGRWREGKRMREGRKIREGRGRNER